MQKLKVGRKKTIPIRTLFEYEERDFSAWIGDNITDLANELNIKLSDVHREVRVGDFEADLVAKDGEGKTVVIENQLESTDHSHLGQLVAYASNLGARVAVWIATEVRPEHKKAVQWLNEIRGDVLFYLVKVQAISIDGSNAAPDFRLEVSPNKTQHSGDRSHKNLTPTESLRLRFWEQLLQRAEEKSNLPNDRFKPSRSPYISIRFGKKGVHIGYQIATKKQWSCVYVLTTAMRSFVSNRRQIEKNFGQKLEWERRWFGYLWDSDLENENNWPREQNKLITAMNRLARAVQPFT